MVAVLQGGHHGAAVAGGMPMRRAVIGLGW